MVTFMGQLERPHQDGPRWPHVTGCCELCAVVGENASGLFAARAGEDTIGGLYRVAASPGAYGCANTGWDCERQSCSQLPIPPTTSSPVSMLACGRLYRWSLPAAQEQTPAQSPHLCLQDRPSLGEVINHHHERSLEAYACCWPPKRQHGPPSSMDPTRERGYGRVRPTGRCLGPW